MVKKTSSKSRAAKRLKKGRKKWSRQMKKAEEKTAAAACRAAEKFGLQNLNEETLIFDLRYYNIIPLALLGAAAVFSAIIIFLNIRDNLIRYFLSAGLISLWGYGAFISIREKRYRSLTGRSFKRDQACYNKDYRFLVRFWQKNDRYKMRTEDLPVEDWHAADGIILCKCRDKYGKSHLVKRPSDANGNLASFGLPGSGKSTTQAATTALRFNAGLKNGGCGVFAISIKGDLLNFVNGKRKNIRLFTPDKAEGSLHYNPLEGVSGMSATERRTYTENLSIIVCPDEQGENSAFFVGGARDYFCGIMHYLLYLHDTGQRDGDLKFPELIDTILSGNVFDMTLTIKNSNCALAGEYTNSYEGSAEKNVCGIYNHLCKSVRPFNSGALRILFDGNGDCISPEDLNSHDIYIDVPQDKYAIYAPAMAIIVTNFLTAFMRRPDVSSRQKTVPILFLLDEAVQLNLDFSILSQAMSTLRSKKVSIFLLMQSIAQLEGRYGDAQAREIMDLCAYISIFNAQDPQSREYFQKLVGRRKVLKQSTSASKSGNSNSTGSSVSEEYEYIFEAADFGNLDFIDKRTGKAVHRVMVYANGQYILGETTPCYE